MAETLLADGFVLRSNMEMLVSCWVVKAKEARTRNCYTTLQVGYLEARSTNMANFAHM